MRFSFFHSAALDLFQFNEVSTYYDKEQEPSVRYIEVEFRPIDGFSNDEEHKAQLLGTITKVETMLHENAGGIVERRMDATSWMTERIDVRILASVYGKPVCFRFSMLPTGDNCRIEVEEVEVPASVKKVQKVVCD